MSKVKKITVSNLKAVSNLTADFNGCTAIITGGNNKGKSSFLKSLPQRLQGYKTDLILKQGEKEGFAEWELTTGEKFIWEFDGKKEKLIFISERNIKSSITKDLSTHYFPSVFDVDEFLSSPPAKQKSVLQKLTGIDFTEIDRLYKEAYENRTWANKKLTEEKARLLLVDHSLPAEKKPTAKLEKQIASIEAIALSYNSKIKSLTDKQNLVADNESEIKNLKAKIVLLQEKNTLLNGEIFELDAWVDDELNKPTSKEQNELLQQQLDIMRDENKQIEDNIKAIAQQKQLEQSGKDAEEADKLVKHYEAEKLAVIKNSTMPDGFGFNDDGITYNGFPFNKEQLSSSGIYIAALKLAALGLGEVKTLHFDASYLDKNSLADIEKWASDNNLQLLIERPSWEPEEISYEIIQ